MREHDVGAGDTESTTRERRPVVAADGGETRPLAAPAEGAGRRPRMLMTPRNVVALQRAVGNREIARLLSGPKSPTVGPGPAAGPAPVDVETPVVQRREEDGAGRPAGPPGRAPDGPPGGAPTGGGPPGGTGTPSAPSIPSAPGAAPAVPPAASVPAASAAPAAPAGPPPAAPTSRPPAPAGPSPDADGGGAGAPSTLEEVTSARRAAVRATSTARQERLRAAATSAATTITTATTTEQERIQADLAQALAQVRSGLAQARDGIQGQRRAKLAEVREGARAQHRALDDTLDGHKRVLQEKANARAGEARRFGEDEAGRAVRECGTRAGRARAIGEQKAAQYRDAERGARIAAEAREMAGAAADQIVKAGAEAAKAVRKDAADLADKILKEGRDAGERFEETRRKGHEKITGEETSAVRGIDKAADDAIAGLEQNATRLVEQIQQQQGGVTPPLGRLAAAGETGMRAQADAGVRGLDQQATQAEAAIDTFRDEVAGTVTGVPAAFTAELAAEADQHLAATLGDFDAAQESQVTDAEAALDGGGTEGAGRIAAATGQATQPLTTAAADFEATAADTMSKTNHTIDDLAAKALEGMRTAVSEVDREAGRAVREADAAWGRQIADGRAQAARKVDDMLTAQDRVVNELGGKIDSRAREIQEESWLSRVGKFLAGVLVGFLEELWDFVKVLLWIVLIVIAVVVVIALVILIFFGVDALIAAILAVAAAIAAASEIIGIVLTVLAVIGAIVLIVVAGWRLYQAWVRDDLSDYERGKLVGRSVFDILSILVPGRFLKFLKEWSALRRLLAAVGGEARFAMLLLWARGDVAAVRAIIADIRTFEELELVIRKTANITEFMELRALVGNDIPRLLGFLRKAPSVAELRAVITALGGDAALLEDLLKVGDWVEVAAMARAVSAAGGDAALIRAMLTKAGTPAEITRLLAIVTSHGGDAPMLGRLLAGTANPTELTGLLTRLGNDAPLLDRLIALTDDIPQLDHMLAALGNDGVKLRDFLGLAGGKPNAGLLRELLDIAVARGKPAGDVDVLLGHVGSNAAEFQRLGNLTKLFHARTPAPSAPGPAMGSYPSSNMPHFLDEHTIAHYDFTKTGLNGQSFWPSHFGAAEVEAELQSAVTFLDTPGNVVSSTTMGPTGLNRPTPVRVLFGGQPNAAVTPGTIKGPVRVPTAGGFTAQFGTGFPNASPPIGQFFPVSGSGVEHYTKAILDAIARICG